MHRRWPLAALAAALTLIRRRPRSAPAVTRPRRRAGTDARSAIRCPSASATAVARFPRGWSAGSVGAGSGYARPNGSRRVREVQRRLLRRGYRPGRGRRALRPRTRAAVIWFQTKHGLPRTGRVDARSVAALRQTPARAHARDRRRAHPEHAAPASKRERSPARRWPRARADWTWLVLLVVVIVVGLAAIAWWMRTELRRRPAAPRDGGRRRTPRAADGRRAAAGARARERDRLPRASPAAATATARSTPPPRSSAPGARAATGNSPRSSTTPSPPAAASPTGPGWPTRSTRSPPAASRASSSPTSPTSPARSPSSRNCCNGSTRPSAFMIALDYELDTSTAAGELAAGALIEIGDWERGRIADRTRPGLTAIRAQAAATKPRLRPRRPRTQRPHQRDARPRHVTASHQRHPQRRRRPHPARRHPLATLQRPSRHRLQTPTHQTDRRPRLPPLAPANTTNTQGRWDHDPT